LLVSLFAQISNYDAISQYDYSVKNENFSMICTLQKEIFLRNGKKIVVIKVSKYCQSL
jgi:hypothetical protein